MENKKEFYFPSADGKTQIHTVYWLPEGAPTGVLQIAHGVAEHALRYEPFARFLNEHGFLVAANDHLGHGLSVAEGMPRLYFSDKHGWQNVVDDIHTLRETLQADYPDVPHFLLGHSMGSFLARTYLIRYPGTVRGAILMGTGQQDARIIAGGQMLARMLALRSGRRAVSEFVEQLAFGSYNTPFAPNRTDYDWLSEDAANVDRFLADPLCGGMATIGLVQDMLGGIAFIQSPKKLEKMERTTPILFISGGRDPVGDMGEGVRAAYESFLRAEMQDVTLKLYPALRHEVLNEVSRKEVFADLWDWIARYA